MNLENLFFSFWTVIAVVLALLFLVRPRKKSQFLPGRRRTRREQEADDRRIRRFYEGEEQKIFKEKASTPYSILGVPAGASKQEIERAFRRRVRQYHPDLVAHLGDEYVKIAKQRTIKITRAREELLRKFKAA